MRLKKSPNCNIRCHYCFILYKEHLWQLLELSIITLATAKLFSLCAIIDWDYQLTLAPSHKYKTLSSVLWIFFHFCYIDFLQNIPLLVANKDAPKLFLSVFYHHALSSFAYLIQYAYLLKVPWQIFAKLPLKFLTFSIFSH